MSDRRVSMDIGEARSLAFRYETIEIGLRGLADDIEARAWENPLLASLVGMAVELRAWEGEVRDDRTGIETTAAILEGLEHTYEISGDLAENLPPMPASMVGKSTEDLLWLLDNGTEEEQEDARTALLLKASADPEVASLVIVAIGDEAYQQELDRLILAGSNGVPGAEELLALWVAPLTVLSYAVDDEPENEVYAGQLSKVLGTDGPPTGAAGGPVPTSERLDALIAVGSWGTGLLLGLVDYGFENVGLLTTNSSWGFFRAAVTGLSNTQSGALDLVEWMFEPYDDDADDHLRLDDLVAFDHRFDGEGWDVDSAVAEAFDAAFAPGPGHPMFASRANPYVQDPTLDAFDASVDPLWQRQQELLFAFEGHVAATGEAAIAGAATKVAASKAIYLHDPGMRYARGDNGVTSTSVKGVVAVLGTEPVALGVLMAGAAYANARETYQSIMTNDPTPIRAAEDIVGRTNGFADALDDMHVPLEMEGFGGFLFGATAHVVGVTVGRSASHAAGSVGDHAAAIAVDSVVQFVENKMGYGIDPNPTFMTGRQYRELVVIGAEVKGAQMAPQFDLALANAYLAGESAVYGDASFSEFEEWQDDEHRFGEMFTGDIDTLADEESRLDDVMSIDVLGVGVLDGTLQQEMIRERAGQLRADVRSGTGFGAMSSNE